jgi:hypothetical protein
MKTLIVPVLTVIFLFALNSANAQGLFIDTARQNKANTPPNSEAVVSNFIGLTEFSTQRISNENEESHEEGEAIASSAEIFKVDTITQKDFDRFKKQYKTHIDTSESKIIRTDTSFIITTEKSKLTFVANKNDYGFFEYYQGLLVPLNLYLVHSIDGHNEIGWLQLIDKKTGKSYQYESDYDYPIETVFLSPKKSYLLGLSNDMYTGESMLSLLQINSKGSSYYLSGCCKAYLTQTVVEELVWINEKTFAIKVLKGYVGEISTPSLYLKLSFIK